MDADWPALPPEFRTRLVKVDGQKAEVADGETGYLRAMTPEDAPALLSFHERQPRENLYRRFFSPKPSLTPSELEHFTVVDFVDRVALVLEIHGEFAAVNSFSLPSRRNSGR